MNFDSGNDECYIDTHLGTKSSIYRALTGDKSSINVNLLGNNSAIGVSLNGNNSYIRAVLDNYSVLNIYAIGNDSNKSLDYVYLSSGYDEDDGIGANNSPLLFFKKGGTANPNKYGLYFNTETHELGYIAKENNIIEVFDLGYLKKLTTQGYKIYAHSGTSQFELDYDINATSNSIVQRDSNGQVIMNSPTTPLAGTNKQYVDELVNSKLDKKTTTGTYVYTHNGSTQDEIQYSNNYNPHTIALRDAYGGIKINTPLDAYHAVNVKYLQANYYNKSTIDSKLASIGQFKYIVSTNASTTPYGIVWYSGSTKITGSLVASSSTEYIIYLVPCKHTAAETQKGYDEYLTINNNGTYSWEVLGNTADIDLSDYVKVEDKNYFTGNITISGSGTISTVGSGDAAIVNKQYVDTAVENAIVDTGNIPEPPNTVGTYTLKATVSTSTTTKTVSDPVLVGAIPSGFNAYYHSTTLKTNLVKGTLYLQFSTNNSTWSDAGYDDGNGGWSGRSDISVNYDTGVVEVEVKASPIARTDYYLRISSYNYTETSIVKTLSWGGE